MATTNFNDAEVDAIVAEVEQQLRSTATRLAKAAEETPGEGHPGSPEASPAGSAPPPPSSTMPDAGGSTTPPEGSVPEGSPSASPEGAPPAGPEGNPPPGAEGGEEGPASVEELTQAYSQLPPEELKAHFLACKAAIEQVLGAAGGGAGPEAGAPPPGAGGPPAGGPPPEMAPAAKGEASPSGKGCCTAGSGAVIGSPEKAIKSEVDVLRAEIENLKKAQTEKDDLFLRLENGIAKIAGKPLRKAVTSVSAMGKPGDVGQAQPINMTRGQAIEKLAKKATDPKLTSAQREKINQFTVGSVDISVVADLLKD